MCSFDSMASKNNVVCYAKSYILAYPDGIKRWARRFILSLSFVCVCFENPYFGKKKALVYLTKAVGKTIFFHFLRKLWKENSCQDCKKAVKVL